MNIKKKVKNSFNDFVIRSKRELSLKSQINDLTGFRYYAVGLSILISCDDITKKHKVSIIRKANANFTSEERRTIKNFAKSNSKIYRYIDLI